MPGGKGRSVLSDGTNNGLIVSALADAVSDLCALFSHKKEGSSIKVNIMLLLSKILS